MDRAHDIPGSGDAIREGSVSRTGAQSASRIAPTFLRLGVVDLHEPKVIPPHRHNEYEVILIDHGRYACHVNGEPMDLLPGDGVVVKPGDWHRDQIDGPFPMRYFGLCFLLLDDPLAPAPPNLFVAGVAPHQQRFHLELDRIRPMMEGIQKENQTADPISGHVQDALVLAFFWRMVRALERDSLNPSFVDLSGAQRFPTRLQRLFRDHIDEDLSVADMAEMMGMSESSLSHRCRDVLGNSPRRAFLACKMDRARYLLSHTEMTVKEVAADLGYVNPYSFSRAFKSLLGHSPKASRKA